MQARVAGIVEISIKNYSAALVCNKTEGPTVSGTFKKQTNYLDSSQKGFAISLSPTVKPGFIFM